LQNHPEYNKSTKDDVSLADLFIPLLLTIISLKAICRFSIGNMPSYWQYNAVSPW